MVATPQNYEKIESKERGGGEREQQLIEQRTRQQVAKKLSKYNSMPNELYTIDTFSLSFVALLLLLAL